MSKIKSIDPPLSEITLRRYEKPYNLKRRDLVRKLTLGMGLLNPGDSRDVIVDILCILLDARKNKIKLSSETIRGKVIEFRKEHKLDYNGTASSNIRRQLKRLRELFLVEKVKNDYIITEFDTCLSTFEDKIERYLIPSIIERLKNYMKEVDREFGENE